MWMTIEETAVYLKVSKETLYRLVQQGKLPGSKLGNQWRFHKERLDEWLYSQGLGKTAAPGIENDASEKVTK